MTRVSRCRGFTLIEVIVVVALIGIIAAAIGPMALRQINGMREVQIFGREEHNRHHVLEEAQRKR